MTGAAILDQAGTGLLDEAATQVLDELQDILAIFDQGITPLLDESGADILDETTISFLSVIRITAGPPRSLWAAGEPHA